MKKTFVPSLELNHNSLMCSQVTILCAVPAPYYVRSVSGLALCGLHVLSLWHIEDYYPVTFHDRNSICLCCFLQVMVNMLASQN